MKTKEQYEIDESIFDSVAIELIEELPEDVQQAYYSFQEKLQEAIRAKFPNETFGNF